MGYLLAILILSTVISTTISTPIKPDAEWLADKFEGDIELTVEQEQAIFGCSGQDTGIISESMRWPDNTVPYIISGDFTDDQKNYIRKGLDTLELVTCIEFVERTTQESFVNVTSHGQGCYSNVGCLCRGKPQTLNLQPSAIEDGCFRLATIMHEFIHVLGFYHMHSAYDRDNYVQIAKENILEGKELNFNKYQESYVSHFGVEYDYNSVMHYGELAGSKNGLPTIIPKDPQAKIGQRVGLSRKDIEKINRMYNCVLD